MAIFAFVLGALLLICAHSFNIYKAAHPLRKTTHLFERLKYHEIVSFSHNQLHHIDTGNEPIYPTNGKLEFDAFGKHYTLLIRKNMELFSDSFRTEIHSFNHTTQTMDKHIHSTEIPQCYYTAELTVSLSAKSHIIIHIHLNHKQSTF